MFTINNKPIIFATWKRRGITSAGNLFSDGSLMTFDLLKQIYNLQLNCQFQYVQLKEIIQKVIDIHNFPKATSPLLVKINSLKPKQLLSQIYKLFSHHDNTTSLPIDKWTSDLQAQTENNWQIICTNTFTISSNSNIQLIQYKILHRTHITTHKMHLMGLTDTNTCTYCPTITDNHHHAFWNCPPVRQFWSEVMRDLSVILSLSIPLSPTIALLGDLSSLSTPKHLQTFILISITVAKKNHIT